MSKAQVFLRMQTKMRHHYVPQFYLSGFTNPADESQLWVYEKGKEEPFKASPESIGFQRYYYSFEKPDGTRDTNTIEDMYSMVEQSAAEVISKIVNREMIDGQAKANLAYFVAFQMTRIPRFRKHVEAVDRETVKLLAGSLASDPEHFASIKRSYEQETGKTLDLAPMRRSAPSSTATSKARLLPPNVQPNSRSKPKAQRAAT